MLLSDALTIALTPDSENLKEALAMLVAERLVLTRRIYFTIPADEMDDPSWTEIIAGSEAVSAGNQRLIMPGAQRQEFAAGAQVVVSKDKAVLLRIAGAFTAATILQLHVVESRGQIFMTAIWDPFDAVTQLRLMQQGTPAVPLEALVEMAAQGNGIAYRGVPVCQIAAVDLAGTVALSLDRDIEAIEIQVNALPVETGEQEDCDGDCPCGKPGR